MDEIDTVIVGSGMGGATLAAALAPSGRRIVILERGPYLEDSPEARDADAIFARGHYRPQETWLTPDGTRFNPGNYAYVGGNSKFYGAVLLRYRARDFARWPFDYATLEPYYQRAEALFQVRGDLSDPSEPPHSGTYPHPPVPHEPAIADLAQRLARIGLHPAPLPLGVDPEKWLARAQTPWDAFPDTTGAKMDAESVSLAAALQHPNVTLRSDVTVRRLRADNGAWIAETSTGDIPARRIVLAAGAVHTAAILLRSGLGNGSGQVGRNFMNHNTSALLALSPRRNRSVYQKTLQVNDWYAEGLGNVQLLGRVSGPILAAQTGLPRPLAKLIADHAIDFYAMSEDFPDPQSRVTLRGEDIVLDWRRSNYDAHTRLVARLKRALRRAGFPIVLSKAFDRRTPSHQCGTARIGDDPRNSVCDPIGRVHDHPGLSICDASLLPSSAAVNPSLTIAALALRQAEHLAAPSERITS